MSDANLMVVSMVGQSSEIRNVAERKKFILISIQYGHCITQRANFCGRAILAITKANVDALPTLFRTYDTSDSLKDCAIWEVARATSAATTFFKSIKCGRDEVEFIDAGFGYNNPCEILLSEAQSIFAGAEFGCILSIGTGIGGVVSVGAHTRNYLAESQTPLAKCSAALQRQSTTARTTEHTMPSGES